LFPLPLRIATVSYLRLDLWKKGEIKDLYSINIGKLSPHAFGSRRVASLMIVVPYGDVRTVLPVSYHGP
jgi:hypothetical protein